MIADGEIVIYAGNEYYWRRGKWCRRRDNMKVPLDIENELNSKYKTWKMQPAYKKHAKIQWKSGGLNHCHPYHGGIPGSGKNK